MNANELTEIIEHLENAKYIGASKAATMLRQQQSEIEALKQIIDANNLNQNIGQFVKPTNEPVAWFEQDPDMKSVWYQSDQDNPNAIPLYTHPVKELDEDFDAICLENKRLQAEIEALKVKAHEWYLIAMGKAQEQ